MKHRLAIWNWFRPRRDHTAAALYSSCVHAARQSFFYQNLGVPDTVDGRFDLLVLHMFLLLHRLKESPARATEIIDLFFADMDQNLRQMGVADPGVGKRIRVMLDAFYGRIAAYESTRTEDPALSATLIRNLYGTAPVADGALPQLLAYVRRCEAALAALTTEDIASGHCRWPEAG